MKHLFLTFCLLFSLSAFAQENIKTGFELEGKTSTYREVINYYKSIASHSPYVEIKEMGQTDSGEPLHLVILDLDKDFDFDQSRSKGKTVLLVNNGIHPGEPDGIEACQMLLRDFATNPEKKALIKNTVIALIPIYNIGGAVNRNSTTRVNQNGPKEYGFRGNARNYDLNRDFIKADTRNTKAFYQIFHEVDPDIFIDTHVSNGADYQYSITHLATQHDKIGGEMGTYIKSSFTPQLESLIAKKGSEIIPYVNVFNQTPDSEGITQFMDYPRYSTGYTALFNTLGFMIETHMLKPFDVRVKATYHFLESVIEIANKDGDKIRKMHHGNKLKPGDLYPVKWSLDETQKDMITFKGYEGEMKKSEITGMERLYYDRDKPFEKKIPYYNSFKVDKEVILPQAYIIPQGWHEVIDRLKLNHVEFTQLETDTTLNVESYRIESFDTYSNPYEGHYPHNNINLTVDKQFVKLRKGDYLFVVSQPAGRYLVETLEPETNDSFFAWNFFDTILQQKEGFSPYVFEDLALKILSNNREIKEDLEKKKSEDKEFAEDWYAQLYFIYTRSSYYENAHMQYPVYRLME